MAARQALLCVLLAGLWVAPAAAAGPRWTPATGTSFQWQLDTPVDLREEADVYDIDLFDNDVETVERLHALGRRVVCYISVGTVEAWRPDADTFPSEVVGKPYDGWPGERWLDIRKLKLVGPVLKRRLDLCRDRGFDGVEPDNVDAYKNDTGFPIRRWHQLRFDRWLARQAHRRGLSIGLKNSPRLARKLVKKFDWMLTEECFDQGWCSRTRPFVEEGKAVFAVEYTDTGVDFERACRRAPALGLHLLLKDRDLDAWRRTCGE